MRKRICILAALMGLPVATAFAAEAERYRLEKSGDGYVRMDTQTGALSICAEQGGQLVCKVAADERAAYDDELQRLQDRLDRLDARIATLEKAGTPAAGESLDESLGTMEQVLRRFMGVMKDLQRDWNAGDSAAPERT